MKRPSYPPGPRLALAPLLALASACAPALEEDQVVEALLKPSHGLIAGVDIGDSWQKIKADHDSKLYAVRDEPQIHQLRHDMGKPGHDGWYVTLTLEGDTVEQVSVSIHGRKKNAVTVRKVADRIIDHYDAKIGKGACSDSKTTPGNFTCDWKLSDGSRRINLHHMAMTDPIAGVLKIAVAPAS